MSSSPLIDAGLNLAQFSINPGPTDFFGNPVADNNKGLIDIGADEAA
jgi:hypothetical protein